MEAIRKIRFGDESDLFGREKDDYFAGSIGNHVSLLPRQKQGPVLRRKETNRGLHVGDTNHHDCGVLGRGEGNDGERGDELYVGEINKKPGEAEKKEEKEEKASKGVDRGLLFNYGFNMTNLALF